MCRDVQVSKEGGVMCDGGMDRKKRNRGREMGVALMMNTIFLYTGLTPFPVAASSCLFRFVACIT